MIVGASYYNSYFKKLKSIIEESDIIFTNRVEDRELPLYYAACDVYATCSLWEGFNLPLVEAQACGKPVVAFDIGPHREVVKNGILVKKGDVKEFSEKLVEILKNKYRKRAKDEEQ